MSVRGIRCCLVWREERSSEEKTCAGKDFPGLTVLYGGRRCREDRWPRSLPPVPACSSACATRGTRPPGREFVDLYAPLVYGYARKQGLQDADAADLSPGSARRRRRRGRPAGIRPAARGLPQLAVHGASGGSCPNWRAAQGNRPRGSGDSGDAAAAGAVPGPGGEEARVGGRVGAAACSPGPASRSAATSPTPPGRRSGGPPSTASPASRWPPTSA